MIITKPTRTDANGRKLYPFNMVRYGHNIELAYNHQWLICREMEDGERDWDKAAFVHLERLEDEACRHPPSAGARSGHCDG